ncbi:FGGY family carbohydrate kinase [Brevibacterium aurantiacum]|uniref:Glycerol kinase n=1 Tax=Brevibacterium aurantiacum TaxID=273384 RepID=A0A556CD41_BREAU|nr:FGGY family carbohydrate kinase [Brevibacterium aurantiacum]TSI15367.1 glycerol kinase [Brevibacterium aurantiacum]
MRRAVLAIDEGTTGTRAAWVTETGEVGGLHYQRLSVASPRAGVVEQSAAEILDSTLSVLRAAYASAVDNGLEITSVSIAAQRATATLWDAVTGQPLAPSMVWQDSRHSAELASLAGVWDQRLWPSIGRPTGVRSVYLWAKHQLEDPDHPEVKQAFSAGRLVFGTVDTWLLWNLSRETTPMVGATNATSSGSYLLGEHAYRYDYIDELGFPRELLPQLRDDVGDFGTLRPEILGPELPIHVAIGDQHAGIVGLGAVSAGQAMCVHGTGSFVDLNVGEVVPENTGRHEGALSLVAWRAAARSMYSVETFTATTGSVVDWLVNTLRLFDSAEQLSELAGRGGHSRAVSIPALTGVRMPQVHTGVGALIGGLSTATTREDVAYSVLAGIAHSVTWCLEANEDVAGLRADQVIVGGGLSKSEPLIQLQADLTGVPFLRYHDTDKASLRGAAFLAGVHTGMWADLAEAKSTLGTPDVFEPRISDAEREDRRGDWRVRVKAEIELADARVSHNSQDFRRDRKERAV